MGSARRTLKAACHMAADRTRTLTTALRSSALASVYQQVAKAHATRKLSRRVKWRGCDISVEQDKGESRKGVDADGHAWETTMAHPYGYLKGTQGQDGDHTDAFLLEHDDWENCPVHIVHQVKANAPTLYDEDKLVLGARDEREARAAYLANYDGKGEALLGAMSIIPPEHLEAYVKGGHENWGRPLVHSARQKIALQARQVQKAQALLAERREWMRGVVAVAKAGGPHDEQGDDETQNEEIIVKAGDDHQAHIASAFRKYMNIPNATLLKYASGELGQKSGLSRGEAAKQGIASGRDRPRQIVRLKEKGSAHWTDADYAVAGRVVSFCARMTGNEGPLRDDKGRPTRKLLSLWIWGHNPAGGGSVGSTPKEVEKALSPLLLAEQAMAGSHLEVIVDIAKADGGGEGRRLLRITPSFEAIDLQNQLTTKAVIREAWPYYEQAGNFDLEHLTKKGGKNLEEYRRLIEAQGFKLPEAIDEIAGRDYYELGRPVAGSFDPESCTCVVEIYKGHPVADWFWHTLTAITPAWPWKCSIGGAAKLTEVVAENPEPIFGKGRVQKFEVLRQFRWNNTAATCEPVNNYCPPVEVVTDTNITKGIALESQEAPMSTEMTKASDVLKSLLLEKAQDALSDMHESGQLDGNAVLAMTSQVAKALSEIEADVEVVKALDYGNVTTDSALLTQGGAFTGESLSTRAMRRIARELLDDTRDGETPFQKGFTWSDDPVIDVAEYLQDDLGLEADDAIGVAKAFFGLQGV